MSELKEKVISEIKKIYDPEIPINIYELGLIYNIEVIENKRINSKFGMRNNATKPATWRAQRWHGLGLGSNSVDGSPSTMTSSAEIFQ